MAATGHDWGAWAFATKSGGGDWDDLAQADGNYAYSQAISLDKKSACIIGIELDEDSAASPDTNGLNIFLLGDSGDGYEEHDQGNPLSFNVLAVTSEVIYLQFSVDPRDYDNFKIGIENDCGEAIDTTVRYKTADIPVAS